MKKTAGERVRSEFVKGRGPFTFTFTLPGVLRTPWTPLIHFVGVGRLNGGRTAIRKFLGDFWGAQGNPEGVQGDPRGAQGKIIEITPPGPPLGTPGVPQTVEGSTV